MKYCVKGRAMTVLSKSSLPKQARQNIIEKTIHMERNGWWSGNNQFSKAPDKMKLGNYLANRITILHTAYCRGKTADKGCSFVCRSATHQCRISWVGHLS